MQLAYIYNKSNLPTQIMELFHLTSEISSHNTCAHCNKALFIPSIKSFTTFPDKNKMAIKGNSQS